MEKINKAELKTALEVVKPGLANNAIIEQSTSFCFKDGFIITYNDEISIKHPIGLNLEGAVNANELYGFINKVSAEEIEMEVGESEILLHAGRAKVGLKLQSEIILPIEEVGEISKWIKLPEGFLKALDFARGACGKDMSKPIMTCTNINGNIIEGSDGYRVARTELEKPIKMKPTLIPATICGVVIRFKPTEIAEGKGWIHFKGKNDAVLSCRIFEESYVKTEHLFGIDGDVIEFPKTIMEILEKAEIFAKRDRALDESVTITIEGKKLTIRSESDNGWFEEKTKIEHTGEPITFSVTLYLLKDILKQTNTAVISENKLLFEGEGWKYLTLLRGK